MIMAEYEQNRPYAAVPGTAAPAPEDECLDWDAEISQDEPDYVILPEGNYRFTVVDIERGRHGGSPKLPPCNKATLTLHVHTKEGDVRVRTNLFLHKKTEWKVSQFFRSIGKKGKGEKIKMDWPHAKGAVGWAHIGPSTYTAADGSERRGNEVKEFLPREEAEKQPAFTDVTGQVDVPF